MALARAKVVQAQLNTIIVESGTSDAETLQLRVDSKGNVHTTANDRITNEVNVLDDKIGANELALNQTVLNVKTFGAVGDGVADDTTPIQRALNEVGNYGSAEVYVPEGVYKVTAELYIHANTYFHLHQNAVLLRHHDDNILRNYNTTDQFYGYGGNGNVTIEGGVFDCNGMNYPDVCNGIAWAHAEGITMRNVTVKDTVNGHGIELTGVRDVLIDGCKFIGWRDTEGDRRYYFEAIQIELTSPGGYIGATQDYTETQDVLIQNCYFGNSGTPGFKAFNCGVGSHGALFNKYYSNIKVINNTFEGCSYWAVRAFKWRDSVITNNKFVDCPGSGIYIVTPNTSGSTKDESGTERGTQGLNGFTVTENRFNNIGGRMIKVEGQEGAYINDVQVLNNRGHTIGGIGIELSWVGGSVFSNNRARNVTGRGISINNLLYCTVSSNKYENVSNNGVYMENSRDIECHSNTFTGVDFYGFNITGSNTDIALEKNRLKNVALAGNYDGIIVGSGASDIRIVGNKIKTTGTNVPRFGLNIQSGVTGVVRYGNDFRCNASSANLGDSSTNPVTTPGDAV